MLKRIMSILAMGFLILLSYSSAQVTARRVLLEVKDTQQNPIEGAKISVSSPERGDFKREYVTNKKGQSAFLVPIEIKRAHFRLEKEGYQNHQEDIELIKLRKSQEQLLYEITFNLYRNDQQTPEQKAHYAASYQIALTFFDKGIELFNSGDFEGSIGKFEKAVETKPDFHEAYQNLASAYFRIEDFNKAIESAKKALGINSNSPSMIRLMAISFSKLGDEKAAQEYQQKLKGLPDTVLSPEEIFNLAVVEANKGNDSEAIKYFERAVQLKPELSLAHYHLGVCYFRMKDMGAAKLELEKYLALEPEGENAKTAEALLDHINKASAISCHLENKKAPNQKEGAFLFSFCSLPLQ